MSMHKGVKYMHEVSYILFNLISSHGISVKNTPRCYNKQLRHVS